MRTILNEESAMNLVSGEVVHGSGKSYRVGALGCGKTGVREKVFCGTGISGEKTIMWKLLHRRSTRT